MKLMFLYNLFKFEDVLKSFGICIHEGIKVGISLYKLNILLVSRFKENVFVKVYNI